MTGAGILQGVALVTAMAYAAASVAHGGRKHRTAEALLGTGWALNLALLLANGWSVRDIPLGNMYHVLVALGLCVPPIYALLRRPGDSRWTLPYFAAAAAVPLTGALFLDKQEHWQRMPALQSPWFVPHVLSYMIGYALCTVAFAMVVVKRIRRRRMSPDLFCAHDIASYRILLFGFPFMTFGMLSGMIWADNAWGTYWSWDPKETWSLITWALYVIYFHCRADQRLQRFADAAHVAAFVALLITFLLVNLLPRLGSNLHSYA